MKFKLMLMTFMMAGSSVACATFFKKNPPLPTVASLDVNQYVGKWYTITTLPQRFTSDCVAQTADYGIISEGKISVLNTCYKANGEVTDIEGFAKATKAAGIFKLQFTEGVPGFLALFGFKADYNIIALDTKYRYALIGGKDRKSLWFLSRTKTVSDAVYNQFVGRAEELGYDTSKLVDSKF
jgi:apolipoprotein D and lipocalin family protein